jgi:hypothetical protein
VFKHVYISVSIYLQKNQKDIPAKPPGLKSRPAVRNGMEVKLAGLFGEVSYFFISK